MRERENVHSTTASPQAYISSACVCVHTCQCFFFFFSPRRDTVCVCCMNTAQRLVCEVTDSFITACTHGETAASTWRREDGDVGQARFTVGPVHVNSAVSRREGWENRGQLLSLLMSTHFFHQLSIYRPVLHSIPSIHTYLKGTEAAGDSQKKLTINSINCQPSFNPKQITSPTLATLITSVACVIKTCDQIKDIKYSQYN